MRGGEGLIYTASRDTTVMVWDAKVGWCNFKPVLKPPGFIA